jgi:Ca-activated chloride channel family protein
MPAQVFLFLIQTFTTMKNNILPGLCLILALVACQRGKEASAPAITSQPAPPPVEEETMDMVRESAPAQNAIRFVPPVAKMDRAVDDLKMLQSLKGESKDRPEPEMTEQYAPVVENPFADTKQANISTFSIDVDVASYANVRRFLNAETMPPPDAVRIEEMINYFDYQYNTPRAQHPFEVYTEVAPCPWEPKHRLLLVGLQGKTIDTGQLPASNLVFLLDVSGSMDAPDKLPLVKQSLALLADQLRPNDRVAIVVYAGAAGLVLESTPGSDKARIKAALGDLEAGGSTAGGEGIGLAYATARKHFVPGGNNRVILCTDGDFNVGPSSEQELIKMIEKERESGVYLTVLGFGTGNYQDGKMQSLADKGNGNHGYIDGLNEAKKLFVREFGGTLFAIAKDVKLQLHFNPQQVAGYRLIGYENRLLATEDFHDDTKDAGEMGAGHRVTALYEIVPTGQALPPLSKNDAALVVAMEPDKSVNIAPDDLFVVQLRYKKPEGAAPSQLLEYRMNAAALDNRTESENLLLASTAAEFGLLLRDSKYKGSATYTHALTRARMAARNDRNGYRKELAELIETAERLATGAAVGGK